MTRAVLDASALLALLQAEAGADVVAQALPGACMSAVNFGEVVAKLVEIGWPQDEVVRDLRGLDIEIVPHDEAQAVCAGLLRAITRSVGLSLGDRACLALAEHIQGVAFTADRQWLAVRDLKAEVRMIR